MSLDTTPETPPRQVMPDLDQDVRNALKDSISRFGVLVPILVDQDGTIIDGHNRWAIAEELNVSCPSIVKEIGSEADAVEIATELNLTRRHLPKDTRQALAKSLRERGHSLRAIAGALDVGRSTIAEDLAEPDLQVSGDRTPVNPEAEQVTGTDGKQQPAKKRQWTSQDLRDLLAKRSAGASVGTLATEYECSTALVYDRLRAAKRLEQNPAPTKADAVAERETAVREMAEQGHSSRQIAATLGIGEQAVKGIAKRIGVDIAADAIVGNTRRHDSNRIIEQTVTDLEGTVLAVGLIKHDDIDPTRCTEWATSLTSSLRVLTHLNKQLKEMTREQL